jgi:hypothetical protein
MVHAGVPRSTSSRGAVLTTFDHGPGGRLWRRSGDCVAFPREGTLEFSNVLGAADYDSCIGPLIRASTSSNYDTKCQDWFQYNNEGGFDYRNVCDAKVKCFAGWLFRRRRNKDLNAWTSALNNYFDTNFGCRPFNTHQITALKKKYKEKQSARTALTQPEGALEPAEARMGLPASGLAMLEEMATTAGGGVLYRILLQFISVLFIVRPNTVWGFEPGDVSVIHVGRGVRSIVCISRVVKRHPEFLSAPNRREVPVPPGRGPLQRWCDRLEYAQWEEFRWCTQLRSECNLAGGASQKLTDWLRKLLPARRLRLPPGRKISSYSLRIMGASAAAAAGYDTNWIRCWGLWKTPLQVFTYIQDDHGYSDYCQQLFSFAKRAVGATCGALEATPTRRPAGRRARLQLSGREPVLRGRPAAGRRW